MKFIVSTREMWIQDVEVEAADAADALSLVREGGGELVDDGFEYSHTLEPETWTVREADEHGR